MRALNLSSQAGAQRRTSDCPSGAEHLLVDGQRRKGRGSLTDMRERVQPCFDAAVNGALEQVAKVTGIDLKRVAGLDLTIRDNLVAGR